MLCGCIVFKLSWSFFGRQFRILLSADRKKDDLMLGMGNRCMNGEYLLFLDYDGTPVEWVHDEIKLLHQRFEGLLGNAYLFRTKRGIHVVFLEKHSLGVITQMLDMTSCDQYYKSVPMRYARRVWVLRQTPKKNEELSYLGCVNVGYKTSLAKRSTAHRLWLQNHFTIPVKDFVSAAHWDGEKEIILGHYFIDDR